MSHPRPPSVPKCVCSLVYHINLNNVENMLRWHFLTTLRTHTHTQQAHSHSHICLSRGKHLCSARQAKSVAYVEGPAAQFTSMHTHIHTYIARSAAGLAGCVSVCAGLCVYLMSKLWTTILMTIQLNIRTTGAATCDQHQERLCWSLVVSAAAAALQRH